MNNKIILVTLDDILKDVKLSNDFEYAKTSAQSKLELLIKIIKEVDIHE